MTRQCWFPVRIKIVWTNEEKKDSTSDKDLTVSPKRIMGE